MYNIHKYTVCIICNTRTDLPCIKYGLCYLLCILLLLQSKAVKLLGHVAPQLGIRRIDPNDISSIPEEVCIVLVHYMYISGKWRWDEHGLNFTSPSLLKQNLWESKMAIHSHVVFSPHADYVCRLRDT